MRVADQVEPEGAGFHDATDAVPQQTTFAPIARCPNTPSAVDVAKVRVREPALDARCADERVCSCKPNVARHEVPGSRRCLPAYKLFSR
jgi:hypothetical protein